MSLSLLDSLNTIASLEITTLDGVNYITINGRAVAVCNDHADVLVDAIKTISENRPTVEDAAFLALVDKLKLTMLLHQASRSLQSMEANSLVTAQRMLSAASEILVGHKSR